MGFFEVLVELKSIAAEPVKTISIIIPLRWKDKGRRSARLALDLAIDDGTKASC